jgi:hypothetical protein
MPVSNYLERSIVEQAVMKGVPRKGALPICRYVCHVDAAGGTGQDSFAIAIGHKMSDGRREIVALDALHEIRPKFNPDEAVRQCADLMRAYGITSAYADTYATPWVASAFAKYGITIVTCPLSSSEIYLHSIAAWTAGRVHMLDQERAIHQLSTLKRKIGQAGRETVTHVRGAHDDLAVVVSGVIWQLTPIQQALPGGYGEVVRAPIHHFGTADAGQAEHIAYQASLGIPGGRRASGRFDHPGW